MVSLSLLVARVDELTRILRILKFHRTLAGRLITVDKLSRPMSKELMTSCENFISILSKLLIESRLLGILKVLL